MQSNEEASLDQKLKKIVDAQLFKWFSILGLVNVGAILLGLAYIFFVIPDRAVAQASSTIQIMSQDAVSGMRDQLTSVASQALVAAGQSMQTSKAALDEAESIAKDIELLKNRIKDLRNEEDLARLATVLKLLKESPNAEAMTNLPGQISRISIEVDKLKSAELHTVCNNTALGNVCDIRPPSCPSGWRSTGATLSDTYPGGRCGNGSKCQICIKQ